MKKAIQTVWHGLGKVPQAVAVYIVGLVFAFSMFNVYLWAVTYYPGLTAIPYRMTIASVGCLMYWTVERFSFPRINSDELLKSNPIAYALIHLPYGFIIGSQLLHT